ncbi:hypothetical protein [Nonomuraea typhae]|uniref:hypothetical protein n=1 Tax=Nonomuraea typhae TaxID=2603600 RepID=UPI0012F90DD9|nr:hypothetical protein [Nonomuraea typhae]
MKHSNHPSGSDDAAGPTGHGQTSVADLVRAHLPAVGVSGSGKRADIARHVFTRIAELEAAGVPYELFVGDPKAFPAAPTTA